MKLEIWKEDSTVSSRDADYRGQYRLSAILEAMQKAADSHIEAAGVEITDMLNQGMAWMLMSVDLDIRQVPLLHEAVEISTWNRGAQGVQWRRDFNLSYDGIHKGGQVWAVARTLWTLVDLRKRRILRPSAFPYELPVHQPVTAEELPENLLEKLAIPESFALQLAHEWTVRYSGIDANGHLNNAKYADLCLDAMLREELDCITLRGFRITYFQEAAWGDQIRIFRTEKRDGQVFFRGENAEEKRLFEACLLFEG
ncbi:acyl-[acyl-carrier-protein] thioesterase [Paenibacillus sp. CAA11]|uniref:acyl-[acyl-carrier-protein] thioesterase n=1 Tax=Paenibacillus sp. CAA11 TaxID=1532905 RepID=UPI00131F1A42|nr:acyl-ACP thioesterase domain-containing protein [Paenibacillus sp. CAA11]